MKRILIILFCIFSQLVFICATENKTLLIGESFSVGPSSLNISENSEFAFYGLTYFSNNSVCNITSKSYTNWKGYNYYVYTIEALEEGTFEFTLSATYKDLNSYKSVSKSYKITVLEKYPIDSQKEIIVTVGESFTINPYADWGIPFADLLYSSDYSISDELAFDITPRVLNMQYGQTYQYCELRALKAGVYTYEETINYMKEIPGTYGIKQNTRLTIMYVINVVDVIHISIPNNLSLIVGEELALSPIITDSRATTTLTWQSSNTSVAAVSENGTISAINVGTTIITCTAQNGVSAQCVVTVNPILVSVITLNETEAELTVGENLQLQATIAPENATDKGVTWSSTNEAVAVVNESGLVTAVGSGTCQIKATANDGSGKSASCLVTVEKNNKLTVTDMTQCSGSRGVLNVLLTDEETIMGFQFDLELPAGVTVPVDNSNKLMAALTGNAVNTHSISSSKISDGLYRFIVTPQGTRAISNANGDGMTITIDVADDVAVGTYNMTLKDIEMTIKKTGNVYEDIHPKNSTATLTITEATMGDVNGDGRVSVTDVISMNSYILEEEPAQFIRKVADLNGDGKVTITDMVQVIDIILGR